MKKHGYYCKSAVSIRRMKSFRAKSCGTYLQKCAALPPDVRSTQMIENKLLSLPWRLSKEQVKWLHNKAHDKRPEIRELAQEQLNARFIQSSLCRMIWVTLKIFLLDEDESEW